MAADRLPATVVRTADGDWRPAKTSGVAIRMLRRDEASGESTFLIRVDPGARFPAHDHPGGEELYVLDGDFEVGSEKLYAGDYLYTPPNAIHAASSQRGCLVLVMLPQPVRILADSETRGAPGAPRTPQRSGRPGEAAAPVDHRSAPTD
jgi:quercetin dioxygenase-like cupin family protein